MRVLGVDIGNSGLKLAELSLVDRSLGKLSRINWDFGTRPEHAESGASYTPGSMDWLPEVGDYLSDEPTRWFISSVRRDASQVLLARLKDESQHEVHIVRHDDLPLEVNVKHPERVGIDRLLAAFAAVQWSPQQPLIVIQAGSAVTIDLVTPATSACTPVFQGGAIVPGVPMMMRLLGEGADQLPKLHADDLTELPEIPGKDTEKAMLCGTSSALIGGVQHLVARYRESFGNQTPVILSGGDGPRIASYLNEPLHVETHLVQRGLLALAVWRQDAD